MPRGRAPGYELQRETIVAQAAGLFARQGYTATSMNEVAEACGVSKAALYHYVRDKHELLVEITQGHIVRLLALVDDGALACEPDPERRLRGLVAAFLAVYAGSQNAHRVLTEDVKFLAPGPREQVLGGERRVVAAFAAAIAAARPGRHGAALDKPLAMLLFGMMNWMFTWLQPQGALSHADMAPVVSDLFFGGLAAIRAPGHALPSSRHNNGDTACPSPSTLSPEASSPPASPPLPRSRTSRTPTSTSA
jgi:AcrR family transcriptional regulator